MNTANLIHKVLIALLLPMVMLGCRERQGTVHWNDCREKIEVRKGDIDTMFKTFTCQTRKTNQGKILSGVCASIEYDANGSCKAAYIYYQKQADVCPKEKPFLREDDLCYAY